MSQDTILDLKGLKCPLPVLKTRKALSRVESGTRITVQTTDPMAFLDIPHFCNEDGHTLESSKKDGDNGRFTIIKA
ncbi:sulfurtransferase TusA family protein [Roseibium polysiphoniae]|uniref:sulfurtransferase TusA family protein n=1 Tax=Roseibium polysiphoniae TaxID=2571221 RepID=UPI0032998E3D